MTNFVDAAPIEHTDRGPLSADELAAVIAGDIPRCLG